MTELEHKHKMLEIEAKGDIDKEIAAIKVFQFAEDMDADKDNIPDPIEAAKLQHQINEANSEKYYKDKDVELKEKDLGIKQEQLKLAEKSEKNEMIKFRNKKKD